MSFNQMTDARVYRFAFRTTDDGYLKVTAFSGDLNEVTAIHLTAEVFAAAVKVAGLSQSESAELIAASKQAYRNMGVAVCCESVELDMTQMSSLCFQTKSIRERLLTFRQPAVVGND
jgi:hypothetical protein